jgi:hypothetical protein
VSGWPWGREYDPTPDELGPLSRHDIEPVDVEPPEPQPPEPPAGWVGRTAIVEAEPDAPTYEYVNGEMYGLTPGGVEMMGFEQEPGR